MKINLDIREAFGYSGISNFKRNISIELVKFLDLDVTGCYNWSRASSIEKYNWFHSSIKRSFIPEKIVYHNHLERILTYETMMMSKSDLNLFLTYYIPLVSFKAPLISTIHDIILLKTDSESQYIKDEHDTILRHTISKSHHLLTVSNAAKCDLVDYFKLDPEFIDVVHNGIIISQFEEELTEERRIALKIKYGLPDKFILYFGGYRAHKNIERLLQAYALLSSKERKDLKLVITNMNPKLKTLAAELKIVEDIVFTGFVDEHDKCAMYKSADMVYYASLYEGFGVPVIESQICRTPVITSTTSSLPEASGGFAEHVNPYSIDEIYQAIQELTNDNAKREYLVSNGYINALQYTWQRGAQELYDVLNKFK